MSKCQNVKTFLPKASLGCMVKKTKEKIMEAPQTSLSPAALAQVFNNHIRENYNRQDERTYTCKGCGGQIEETICYVSIHNKKIEEESPEKHEQRTRNKYVPNNRQRIPISYNYPRV